MDIKAKIGDLAGKITGDAAMKEKFEKDPVSVVKELVGNIPPEQQQNIIEGIKAKINLDKLGGVGGALGSLGGMFGKK